MIGLSRMTDRRPEDMQSQDRALHYSASRGKNGLCFVRMDVGLHDWD